MEQKLNDISQKINNENQSSNDIRKTANDDKQLLNAYRLDELTCGLREVRQDVKNLDDKIDAKFEILTNIILQDRQMKQGTILQKSSNKTSIFTAILGGVMGFLASVLMAVFHII